MAYLMADKQFGRPLLADGVTPNPMWNDLVQAATRGLYTEPVGDQLKLDGLVDYAELPVAKVVGMASLGIETHEYPAFVQLPLANLTDNVPSFLPGAYVLDANGDPTETLKTWAEWRPNAPQTATHAIIGLTHAGTDVLGSVIAQLVTEEFVVLSLSEAQAINTGTE